MNTILRAVAAVAVLAGAVAAADPTKAEIAKLGKGTTALVDARPKYGSAFCVAAGGYFVTNEHVVADAGSGGAVKVVLNAGEKEQKVLTAKVVRADKALDLALLKADLTDDKDGPAPLALGDDGKVGELDEVVGFGFPFGKEITKSEDYPSITVSAGSVSSLRRDKDRELDRIQLDGALNPGCSGGPVLDKKGEVVGVVVSGIRGSGLSHAIPVSHVKKFLVKPDITLTAPAVDPKGKYDKVTYKASVLSVPATSDPFALELVVKSDGKERRVAMTKAGAGFEAAVAAFEKADGKGTVQAVVGFADGSVRGPVADATFTVGGKEFTLSGVTKVRFGKPAAVTVGGATTEGELAGLEKVTLEVGGQSVLLALTSARELEVVPAAGAKGAYQLTVIASRGGKEVGRSEVVKHLTGTEPGGVEVLLKGKFVKPGEGLKATTGGRMVSTSGDYIGQGKRYTFTADQLAVQDYFGGVAVECKTAGGGSFTLTVRAPKGEVLEAKEYPKAMRAAFIDKDFAGLDVSGNGRGSNTVAGKFVIWELEMDGTQVKSLAVDFIMYSEGKTESPLVGSVRINSKFE